MINRLSHWIETHPLHLVALGYAFCASVLVLFTLLIGSAAHAQTAPTVSLSANVSSGAAPLAVTLTWSSTGTVGATPCTASGLWTGAKAASGTQTVNASVTGSFGLTCYGAVEVAVISWTAPTTNTDGSPLTNLASYKIYNSKDGVLFGVTVSVPAPASTYSWANLQSGVNYWKMTAVNSNGTESAFTPTVQKTLAVASAVAVPWPVTVQAVPNPPTSVTVVVTTAYNIKNGKPNVFVGNVPLGTVCGNYLGKKWGYDYYEVPSSKVTPPQLSTAPVAVQCAPSA